MTWPRAICRRSGFGLRTPETTLLRLPQPSRCSKAEDSPTYARWDFNRVRLSLLLIINLGQAAEIHHRLKGSKGGAASVGAGSANDKTIKDGPARHRLRQP